MAFGCADRAELDDWVLRVDELGIAQSGIKKATDGSGVSFRDPDGIFTATVRPASLIRALSSRGAEGN